VGSRTGYLCGIWRGGTASSGGAEPAPAPVDASWHGVDHDGVGIAVLGPLTVDGSAIQGRRDRVVLTALVIRPGRPVSADVLADAVWGDDPPASASKNLQGCVARLRKLLGEGAIATTDHGYELAVAADQVDVLRFERLVDRARELLAVAEADRAAYLMGDALALWRGDPFVELESWEPAVSEIHRLHELHLEAEELRIEAELRAGRHWQVLAECQSLVHSAPLRERRWSLLAQAQYQCGNQAEALRAIRRLRSVLSQQLGIDPGAEVLDLERAILHQDPELLPTASGATAATRCPWQGLRSYDVDDVEWFFGRRREVEECLAILGRSRALALVGPSGSGKSSILRAGVGAALRSRGHHIVTLTPGPRPLQSLGLSALEDHGPATVLLVDQCEELFTLGATDEERGAYLEHLTRESTRRMVLIALRADRMGDVAAHPGLRALVERGLYLVGGMDDDSLRAGIEGPARQSGLIVEPGLADLLISEVRHDPGALPLLSHALVETWKRREGNTLTVDGYRASGGIHDAVARSAEHLYGEVGVAQREQLRDLLLRLVSPGEGGDPVLTRVPRRLVAAGPEREELVERLVTARLVTSDQGLLEISHEALARAWPRLRGWLDDDVEGQRILHHLSTTADAWKSLGKPDSELYRGVRLTRALDWRERGSPSLTATEADFLEASRVAAEVEEQSAAARARVQARLIKRLRVVLAGAVVLLVLALAAGGVAALQTGRAHESAATAELAARSALAGSAAARAGAADDIDTALLLGAAAVRMEESPESVSALVKSLGEHPALVASAPLAGDPAMTLDVHPDNGTVAVMDTLHHVRLIDVATGEEVADHQAGQARSESEETRLLRFSDDGAFLAVAATPLTRQPVLLLDAETLRPLPGQPAGVASGEWLVVDLHISHDSRHVAGAMMPIDEHGNATARWIYVWSLDDLAHPLRLDVTAEVADWPTAVLSPDGKDLYTGWPHLQVRDLASGRTRSLSPASGGLEISPDGRLLALAPFEGSVVLVLEARTGDVVRRLHLGGETGWVRFSRDGSTIAAATWHDRDARVWDVRTGHRVAELALGEGSSGAVGLDPSGRTLVSAAADHAVRIWDVDGSRRYLSRIEIAGLSAAVGDGSCLVNPSRDGAYVAHIDCQTQQVVLVDVRRRRAYTLAATGVSGSWNEGTAEYVQGGAGGLIAFSGTTGQVTRTVPPRGEGASGDSYQLTPGGTRVLVSGKGTIGLADANSLALVGRPMRFGGSVYATTGPNERMAFVTIERPSLEGFWRDGGMDWAVVDLEQGTVVRQGDVDFPFATSIAYAPDGRRAAITGQAGVVALIDVGSGRLVRQVDSAHDGDVGWVAFSPAGDRYVTAGSDGTVAIWDSDSGRELARVGLTASALASARFLDDGRLLIVPWWDDPSYYLWDPSSNHAVEFACAAVGRDLTEQEWAVHFGDEPYRETCPDDPGSAARL